MSQAGPLGITGGGAASIALTADTGSALITATLSILGGPEIRTEIVGTVLTIYKDFPFTEIVSGVTLDTNNGYRVTLGGVITLPAVALDGDLIIIDIMTATAVNVTADITQTIRIGNRVTAVGGFLASTDFGDSLSLRYRLLTLEWIAESSMGNWSVN